MDSENKDLLEKLSEIEKFSEDMPERQWKILDAAIKVFAAKGFDGSRTSDIAKEAEVAEGTIFRYYKTKKDLLMGLLVPLATKFFRPMLLRSVEKIAENKDEKSIDEVLNAILNDRVNLIKKNLPLIKAVFMEAAYNEDVLKVLQKDLLPKVISFIDSFAETNIENKNFREVESRLITRTLMSLLVGYIMLSNVYPEFFKGENDEDEIKKIVDVFLYGISNNSLNIEKDN
ncbi:TetR/AcrR family transcriptional regulator [Clostridium thailandense]|uniref:TetR/AcrR family transcriptional regulator n=1 Tax=Clostridium thailandense TaxID=2794346 RepID=UPI003989810F